MGSGFLFKKKRSLKLLTKLFIFDNNILTEIRNLTLIFQNKIIRSGSFVVFIFFCINSLVQAQVDPQFSQYMFNPLAVNPGFSGLSGRINAFAVNRQQWVGLEGAPKTTSMGVDMALNFFGNPGGVGLLITNDETGYYHNINIQGSIAQKFDVGEGKLGVGLSFGFWNQVFDGTKAILNPGGGSYHQDTDNSVPGVEVTGTALDIGIGTYYRHDKYYGGISILHLIESKPNFNEELSVYIPRSFFFTGGYNHALWEIPLVLKPSFLLKGVGNVWQFDLNFSAVYRDKYWGGLSYRFQDAVVLMGGVELANGIRIGYSYDITTSTLNKISGGSHEVMIGYTFDLNLEKREKRYKSVRFL